MQEYRIGKQQLEVKEDIGMNIAKYVTISPMSKICQDLPLSANKTIPLQGQAFLC